MIIARLDQRYGLRGRLGSVESQPVVIAFSPRARALTGTALLGSRRGPRPFGIICARGSELLVVDCSFDRRLPPAALLGACARGGIIDRASPS